MLHHGTNTAQAILIKEKSFEQKYEVSGKNKYIDLVVFNTLVIHNLVTFVFTFHCLQEFLFVWGVVSLE